MILLLIQGLITTATSQTCLSSPNELVWTLGSDGAYHGELTFGAATHTINGVTFTTRSHDGGIPSPTIRFTPGEIYNLTLINNLGPEPQGIKNEFRDWNWTNIHTHGLHISGEAPADDVFTVAAPGEKIEYIYEIPCDHSGGTIWYHPHHHGSTATHVAGGAVGAIVIDTNEYESATFPDWYKNMDEIVLVVQFLQLEFVADVGGNGLDKLFQSTSNANMYLVNGEHQPTVCMTTSVWKKLRIVHSDIENSRTFVVNGDSCSVYLLSKDGVLIHGINNEVPREIPSREMYFTGASRADVAVQCSVAGTYTVTNGGNTIFTLKVDGASGTAEALTPWNPLRPRYLQSTLFSNVDNTENIAFDDDPMIVNGQTFVDKNTYLFTLQAGTIQEFTIDGTDEHPYHVHINHFQIIDCMNGPNGWSEVGDWIDTADFNGNIRFPLDTYGGKVVVHCHILEHEDEGLMGLYKVEGGCDALQGNVDSVGPACNFDSCDESVLNSSFSDYDWAAESANYTPAVCGAGALNNAVIIGASVGGALVFCCIIGVVIYCVLQKKKKVNDNSANMETAVSEDKKETKEDNDL